MTPGRPFLPALTMRRYQFLIVAGVVLLDRISKLLVIRNIPLGREVSIIPGLFQLSHWENTGAAFSIFADSVSPWRTAGLIAFSTTAVAVVSVLLWKGGPALNATSAALSLIMGGALGNLWDRLAAGTVTDFLDFFIGEHHWPPFNVADSAIVIGALLLMFKVLFPPRHGKSAC
ncbi:MAG TPA: signal peptidase II [Candidatus Limnocylindrales bacterium]|nr:signal peptidase II [Candidatus Limnocylindrales bacterium]